MIVSCYKLQRLFARLEVFHELKRKTKGPLGILRKSVGGRSHDAMTA